MKKFFFKQSLIGFSILAVVSVSALAADYKVNGVSSAKDGGATTLTVGTVTADKVTILVGNVAAVWKADPGATYGATPLQSEDGKKGVKDWVLTYTANPAVFAGARQCILKRGADWPGTAELKSLQLDDPKVTCAAINTDGVTHQVDVTGDFNVLGLVPVIEFKDGTRAWGSHPFGQSRGKNVKGQTITLLEVNRDQAGNATKVTVAGNQAKAFFRGRFQ